MIKKGGTQDIFQVLEKYEKVTVMFSPYHTSKAKKFNIILRFNLNYKIQQPHHKIVTEHNISKNTELEIIQEHLENNSGNTLLCSNDSNAINLILTKNSKILSNSDQPLSNYIDNALLTNTGHNIFLKYNQKFDTIIIHNLFEQIKKPKLFLQHLDSILNKDGLIVCSISNFFNIDNIFNILINNKNNNFFNTSQFYDLDRFLLFLNNNNMHVIKLFRIKQKVLSKTNNLDDTLIPLQLIDIYQKIPDHDVTQYIFMLRKGKSTNSETLNFSSEFPKNYLLSKLQEFFEKFTEYENTIQKQKNMILGYENSIEKLTNHINSIESSKSWKLIHYLFKH